MATLLSEPKVQSSQDKLFYKINEVSKITGLKPYVLRYWETEFPQLAPDKDENDQRRYRRKDIDLIQNIKRLLYEEKFTIAGAKQRIAAEAASERPKPAAASKRGIGVARRVARIEPKPEIAEPQPQMICVTSPEQASLVTELASIRSEIEGLISFLKENPRTVA